MGLMTDEAQRLASDGHGNEAVRSQTRGIGRIIIDNSFTLFNAINLILALLVLAAGFVKAERTGGPALNISNVMFLGVVFSATLIRIVQEVRAKLTVDRLSILTQPRITVMRDGEPVMLPIDKLVLGDVIAVSAGCQIPADGVVLTSAGLEVDESLLTGESGAIRKQAGSEARSGSFVVAGRGFVRLTKVGGDTYVNRLTREVKREKYTRSELMTSLHKLLKMLTFIIVPVGALLLYSDFFHGAATVDESMLGAAAAMVGMIPQGLILLIEIAFAVGVVNLGRKKLLVQSLPAIEMLARVDILCLDKTGTITDGNLTVTALHPMNGMNPSQAGGIARAIVSATGDDNSTAAAVKAFFREPLGWEVICSIPFSSGRKYSGAQFRGEGTYLLGAPEILFTDDETVDRAVNAIAEKGDRVLALAHSPEPLGDVIPVGLTPAALITLHDNVRPEAPEVFKYFEKQNVAIKVISGDSPATIRSVAARAGVRGAEKWIDMSAPCATPIAEIAERYSIFCRATPEQKRGLIWALQGNGHTVAMTGDGVNDVLAMYDANVSIAMAHGSDAARAIADVTLLNSNFAALVPAVYEGRRIVNNIERVGSLFLTKTLYSSLLAILYILLPLPYPFIPIQLTFISTLTIGIPSFFLTLKQSDEPVQGDFFIKVIAGCAPTAAAIALAIAAAEIAGTIFGFSPLEISTLCSIATGALGIGLVARVARPIDARRVLLIALIVAAFVGGMVLSPHLGEHNILQYVDVTSERMAYAYLPLIAFALLLNWAFVSVSSKVMERKTKR